LTAIKGRQAEPQYDRLGNEETPMRTRPSFRHTYATSSAIVILSALAAFTAPSHAQRKERQGKEVVDAVCGACHATGANNAPRIGDDKAWAARSAQGLTSLTDHAIKGIRNMPPHGGSPGVSDIEIERAIVYMVNASGAHWVEPVGGASPAVARTSEAIVRMQCAKCHETGQSGAPKIGDRSTWIPRLRKGLDPLVASAVHGHGAMPARGGMADLSDEELRGAIIYMFNYGVPMAPAAPAETPAPVDPRHKTISGTDIYLGLMTAESMRAAREPGTSDIPSGKGFYHLNISLSDSFSHVLVTDAQVKVSVSDGMNTESKPLGLVAANQSVSYGGYFRLSSGSAYNITADIRRPGVPGPIRAKFEFKAP
jgi:cytochrome c5